MDINQNLNTLMKQAQKMQEDMQKAQQQLSELVVEGKAGGGLVIVKMNGRHGVISVKIDASVVDEDVEMLEDLVAAAFNAAVNQIEVASKEKINQLTAGLKIPTDLLKDEDKDKE